MESFVSKRIVRVGDVLVDLQSAELRSNGDTTRGQRFASIGHPFSSTRFSFPDAPATPE